MLIVNNDNINCCKKIFFDWFIFTVYFFLFNYNSKNRAVRQRYVLKKHTLAPFFRNISKTGSQK